MNVFVNGFNSKTGGGRSILNNFLQLAGERANDIVFYCLVPNIADYARLESDRVHIIGLPKLYSKSALLPLINYLVIPRLIKANSCSLVFNLGDVPIPTTLKQIILFDWPYAVFPDSPVWQMMDLRSWIARKVKLFLFKKYLPYVDLVIAQSPAIKARLETYFHLEGIEVVPNAVSLDNLKGGSTRDFQLSEGLNLLYLTHYYPHKNIEIFIPLAKEIIARGLNIRIITTISPDQHPNAELFLRRVQSLKLGKVIKNVGPVAMVDVPSLYMQTDGLLIPTLLESFSGTYVEAMFHGKPIFTSDLDFATGVCCDAAYYFDPFDPIDILDCILDSQNDLDGRQSKIEAGKRILNELMTWEQAFDAYLKLFYKTMKL
jgi:glycosyltransferase involved in cell wall biosynthesis